MKAAHAQFLRFCLVGCVGFVVDAGMTVLLTGHAGLSPAVARVLAFLLAATVTWALNRRFTFRAQGAGRTWLPYVLATTGGALISIAVYLAWLSVAGQAPAQLTVGVALGSVCALAFNFGVSRRFVFRAR